MSKGFRNIIFLVLAVLLLVGVVDIPRFLDEAASGSLRKYMLRIAEVVIPLKDRILRRTLDNNIDIQPTPRWVVFG